MIQVARNSLFFACFALFTSLFGKFLLHIDVNKRAYNHVPGECGVIPNLPGILGLATTTTGRLYLTVSPRDNQSEMPHLFAYHADNRTAREIEIIGKPKNLKLSPGPISVSGNSDPNVFVFNERTKNVDVFETSEYGHTWKYLRTSRHQRYERLIDLTASGPNSFYFVTSSVLGNTFNLLERIVPIPSGQVFFADASSVKQVMFVSQPTGIVFDELKQTLFITSFTRNSIYAVKVTKTQGVGQVMEHDIGCSPTSIWKDFDGSFLVTCHQVRFRYLLNLLQVTTSSPSLVLRVVVPESENKEITITQLYSNDGATISQATIAVRAGRSLLISEKEKILNCQL